MLTPGFSRDRSRIMPRMGTVRIQGVVFGILWISDNRDEEAIDFAMDDEYRRVVRDVCGVADNYELLWVKSR